MNDFLRPCNCVHPADEDCDKCVQEAEQEARRRECGCSGNPAGSECCQERQDAKLPAPSPRPS